MPAIFRFLAAAFCVVVICLLVSCQSGGTASPGSAAAEKKGAPKVRSDADLRSALRNLDMSVRLAAVEELGPRAATSDEAVAALVEALTDSAPLVRRFAAGGLAGVKSPSASLLVALGKLLKDPEVEPRESAARSLAALTPRADAAAVKDLGVMLAAATADKESSVRASALEALGGLGVPAARVVPAIKPALERAIADPVPEVRSAAAAVAGQLGTGVPWSMSLLIKALADPIHDVRKQAVVALEKMGPDAAPATRALARQLRAKEIYLRVFVTP